MTLTQLKYLAAAIDPIIVNSSGGIDFENEVRKVIDSWRFEPNVTGIALAAPLFLT